jgi:hypothetical protein
MDVSVVKAVAHLRNPWSCSWKRAEDKESDFPFWTQGRVLDLSWHLASDVTTQNSYTAHRPLCQFLFLVITYFLRSLWLFYMHTYTSQCVACRHYSRVRIDLLQFWTPYTKFANAYFCGLIFLACVFQTCIYSSWSRLKSMNTILHTPKVATSGSSDHCCFVLREVSGSNLGPETG